MTADSQALQSALDSASSSFFATHASLSPDAQKQLQASWCDAQRQAPYRPTTVATGTAVSNGVAPKKKVRAYIGKRTAEQRMSEAKQRAQLTVCVRV